jgi:hypothetical protein
MSKDAVDLTARWVPAEDSPPDGSVPIGPHNLSQTYGQLAMSFEPNEGQAPSDVGFLSHGNGYSLFLKGDEAVLALNDHQTSRRGASGQKAASVRMKFEGARSDSEALGLNELPGKVNYFVGNDPEQWRANIPTYAAVRYQDIYPGVDVVYYGHGHELEYDFVLAPGADPRVITLAFQGPGAIDLNNSGDIAMETDSGKVTLHKPVIYQEVDGIRNHIEGAYLSKGRSRFGFELQNYDVSKPLVIDPVLSYSTYLGGNDVEIGYAITVDAMGSAYVAGVTSSTNFPRVNAMQGTFGGGQGGDRGDGFVAKLNPAGTALVYSTYFGGLDVDAISAIATDSQGNAYVSGTTLSSNLPTLNGFQNGPQGGFDVFVAKLEPTGSLVYSGYVGGSNFERSDGIAVDSAGNAYITGRSLSGNFPLRNPYQSVGAGAFAAKLDPSGSSLVYSTFLGSNYWEGWGIAVDAAGSAYVTGLGPGLNNTFVSKLSPDGSSLVYSTALGGERYDFYYNRGRIALDAAGNAYITGYTTGSLIQMNALQPTLRGSSDAFVAKLDSSGARIYSTFLGGTGSDEGLGIATDPEGNAYITGWTTSPDFPTLDPLPASTPLSSPFGSQVGFVTKLNPSGSSILFSTYLNGSYTTAISVDSVGDSYLTGIVGPGAFSLVNALQPAFGGGEVDSFVTKIGISPTVPLVISSVRSAPESTGTVVITWTTDSPSSSQVEFGTTAAYGQHTTLDSTLTFAHSVNLTGLLANTTYHYRVKSRNGSGTLATSNDFTFSVFSFPNLGGLSRTTDGLGPLTSGYGRIRPGPGSTTPSGVAIFGYKQGGILVSEMGVPDSPLISSGRTFAEVSAGGIVNTGLAFVNPNSVGVRITFELRSNNGDIVRTGFKDLGPNEHSASFLTEDPYLSGFGFQGAFSFTSTLPVAAIALRGFYNERTPSAEFLMSTLPVIDLAEGARTGTQVVPHFAAGGGFTTQILMVNPTGTPQTGTLAFRDEAGALKVVNVDGAPGSGTNYTVAANGATKLVITGATAGTSVGSVHISPSGSAAPTPFVIFSYKPAGITVSEASVPVTMGSAFRLFVELSPPSLINAGIAIANTSGTPGVVTLSVSRFDGSTVATGELPLQAFGQFAGFLDELIPSLGGQSVEGVLRITTTLPISVVGLRSRYNERLPQRDFLMATTPPTLETALPSSTERFFPQIANGDSFTTQVILFSGKAGQIAAGDLTFYSGAGVPFNLDLR